MKDWNEMSQLEGLLEIIKYCHTPRTRQEIAEHFRIDERTLRRYLNEYMNNIRFPNTDMEIELVEDGNTIRTNSSSADKTYTSSVHPVCLALNLTQVFLLTIGLMDRVGKNDVMYDAYQELANQIYSQISDYGKVILEGNNHGHELEQVFSAAFASEKELFEDANYHKLAYLMKSGQNAVITFTDDEGEMHTVNSKLKYSDNGYTFMWNENRIPLNSVEIADIRIDSYK